MSTIVRAALAAAIVALCAGFYAQITTGATSWIPLFRHDNVSDAERLERLQEFAAHGPMVMHIVAPNELGAAIAGMGLTPETKQALQADLEASIALQLPQAQTLRPPQQVAVHRAPLRLAWITLWDTDVEDGDVVRIDSQGYSRTVTLTKRGDTFAVPVPPEGVISVTGIKDGDGGGITVGLASGAAKAVFPIMSTGQSLELTVTMN